MTSTLRNSLLCFAAPLALLACKASQTEVTLQQPAQGEASLDLAFEKVTLGNGLDVVFHVDRSDLVVAINLAAHVGSAPGYVARFGGDSIPITVVGRNEDHRVVGRATAQGAAARVEDFGLPFVAA